MIASWFWEPKLLLFHCSVILKMWLPLLAEDCCLSSWHHICVTTSRKRRNKKWGYLCFYSRSIPEAILNFYSHSIGPKSQLQRKLEIIVFSLDCHVFCSIWEILLQKEEGKTVYWWETSSLYHIQRWKRDLEAQRRNRKVNHQQLVTYKRLGENIWFLISSTLS